MKTVCVRVVVENEKEAEMLITDLAEELCNLPGMVTQLDMEDTTEKEVEMYEESHD